MVSSKTNNDIQVVLNKDKSLLNEMKYSINEKRLPCQVKSADLNAFTLQKSHSQRSYDIMFKKSPYAALSNSNPRLQSRKQSSISIKSETSTDHIQSDPEPKPSFSSLEVINVKPKMKMLKFSLNRQKLNPKPEVHLLKKSTSVVNDINQSSKLVRTVIKRDLSKQRKLKTIEVQEI
jgi:hypothetical protein